MKIKQNQLFKRLNKAQQKAIGDFQLFLMEAERSENTIKSFSQGVMQFFIAMGDGKTDITKSKMIRFKQGLLGQCAPQTINSRISSLNRYAEFKGLNEKLKSLNVPKISFLDKLISKEEFDLLSEHIKRRNLKHYFILQFLAKTGVRVSELIKLQKKHLHVGYADMQTKGKIRRIHIPRQLIEESAEFFADYAEHDLLFPITTRGVGIALKAHAKRCHGVRPEAVHPHNFRHFFAVHFLKNNNNIVLLADLLGHANVNMTAHYARMSSAEQSEMLNSAVTW